jgi:hypothetical protein
MAALIKRMAKTTTPLMNASQKIIADEKGKR